MSSQFKVYTSRAIGNIATTIGGYTVSSGKQVTVIGLSLANVSNSAINVSSRITIGANSTYMVKNAPVPVGSTLVVVGGDQKIVLAPSYKVEVTSTANSSVDAILSVLEVS